MRPALLFAALVLLSACAPTAVTLAALAVTGMSYATTGKSVTDHALTVVAQRDCALHRMVTRNQAPCRGAVFNVEDEALILEADAKDPTARRGASVLAASVRRPGGPRLPFVIRRSEARVLATVDAFGGRAVRLDDYPLSIEVYALLHDDGSLEVFVHDPRTGVGEGNIELVITIVDYTDDPAAFAGILVNGRFLDINQRIV